MDLRIDLPRAVRLGNVVLLAGTVVSSLFILRHQTERAILANIAETAPKEAAEVRTAASPPRDLLSYSGILEKNPLGKNPAGPLTVIEKREAAGVEPAETRASMALVGTIAGDGRFGFAILEDPATGQQSIHRVGSEIPGAGVLIRVQPDHVILRTQTGQRKVELAALVEIRTAPGAGTTTNDDPLVPETSSTKKPGREEVAFIKPAGKEKFLLDKEGVQKSLQNPQRVLTDARMLPNIVNGVQDGFKVSEVVSGGVYDKLGIQNGDILLKINDLSLNSPDSGIQAFSTLRGMDQIRLNILRGDKKITLSYQVK